MSEPTPTFLLKNGYREAKGAVTAELLLLKRLLDEHRESFFELVKVCRDPCYVPWGDTRDPIVELGLCDPLVNGISVTDTTRHIVLSAVTGVGADLTIVNPVDHGKETQ